MLRKNLLLIFDHPLSIRSFIQTEFLKDISHLYNVKLIYVFSKKQIRYQDFRLNTIKVSYLLSFVWAIYANIYWLSVADKSLSIQNRTWFYNNEQKFRISALGIAKIYYKCIKRIPTKFVKNLSIFFLTRLDWFVKKNNINKIVYVTSGGTNCISDIISSFFAQKRIDLFTILENWDNMSSKAVLNFPPKAIGVWGEQSIGFAKKIHNIESEVVKPIGNARIDWLIRNVSLASSAQSIFFGGGSTNFELEIEYLKVTLSVADKFRLNVFYLPHPKTYEKAQKIKSTLKYKNLIFIGDYSDYKNFTLPRLDEYIEPYRNSKLFISSLSTMNLEARLLGIPSIAIDLPTKIKLKFNYISDRYDHIKQLKDLDIFYFVKSLIHFEILINQILSNHKKTHYDEEFYKKLNNLINYKEPFLDQFIDFIK